MTVLLVVAAGSNAFAETPDGTARSPDRPSHLIVKFRSDGAHALERCAEALSRSGEPWAHATRDGSESLDQLRRDYRLGRVRALMGDPGDPSLSARQRRLADRIDRRRQARPSATTRSRNPRAVDSDRSGPLPDLAHVYRVEVPPDVSASEAARALALDPHVEYAQPDHLLDLDEIPFFDDPFLASQGSWGQPFADLWGPDRISAPLAWPFAQGEGIVVAVVDSGLDRFHPDIAGNVWVNPGEDLDGDGLAEPEDENGIDDDGNGFVDDLTGFDFANSVDVDEDGLFDGPEDISDPDPFDDRGHGTHVAGTIAAVGGNGIGIVGIAPRARVMAVKAFAAEGSAPTSRLWRAVLYAAENGARVINNSWSCGTPCPDNPLAEEVLELVDALGSVVVTSAGNRSADVLFYSPERSDRVLTVGSSTVEDDLSLFSNRGWLLDVVAPGGGTTQPGSVFVPRRNILSLRSSATSELENVFAVGEDYARLAGTSMSAPHVSGAVALLLESRPDLEPHEVRRLVRLSARDRGDAGRDPLFGSGILDVAALIDAPVPDLMLTLESPRPGSTHDPAAGDLIIRGRATGGDVVSIAIEVGAGLSGRDFESIELDRENGHGPILARWDVSEVADGPYTIRLRARLRDGREAEEAVIVGVERNRPRLISSEQDAASKPAISGRLVFWQQEEEGEVLSHDVGSSVFPDERDGPSKQKGPRVQRTIARDGDQRNVGVSGRELVWASWVDAAYQIERCRWAKRKGTCRVEVVTDRDGTPSQAWIAGEWIVWNGVRDGAILIEGCRLGAHGERCRPRPLLSSETAPGWVIQSYDGSTLLLKQGFSAYATCPLDATSEVCHPELFEFTSETFVTASEPIHDGSLIAFSDVGTRPIWPPGCEPGDTTQACIPEIAFGLRYHACWLDAATRRCPEIPVSEFVPFDDAQGVAVSGRRVVWSVRGGLEQAAIRFCEVDRESRMCPVQRLTGHAAEARHPAIDGARVVWEDDRLGNRAIFGFELPALEVPDLVRVRAGDRVSIPIRDSPGTARNLDFELVLAESESGAALDSIFEIVASGAGHRSRLVGEIPAEASGTLLLRIHATTDGGLFTDRTIRLEIEPPLVATSDVEGAPGAR